MKYLDFLKKKLQVENDNDLIDAAVKFLGDDYPLANTHNKGYKIVDEWLSYIESKWNIEFSILNLNQSEFLGKLVPKNKGFIVNLNKNLFSTKKRFTIAHEIAHILSYNTSTDWPRPEIRYSKTEEYYCDRIARAIILPKSLIDFKLFDLKRFNNYQLNYLKKLWREYEVSFWQIIIKLYEDLNDDSLVCIYWKFYENESILRIEDYLKPYKTFIPKKKHADLAYSSKKGQTNVSPAVAFNSNQLFQGYDNVEIGSLYKMRLFCTTFPIKTKSSKSKFNSYVVQIIDLKSGMSIMNKLEDK
jgi:Zn-dependent peptidase ImmA (M78 family)